MSSATMPTKAAASHSIASMNRSMRWRRSGADALMRQCSFREGTMLLQCNAQLRHHLVGVWHLGRPFRLQRFGGFLPGGKLLRGQLIDVLPRHGGNPVAAAMLEIGPGTDHLFR